MSFTFTVTEDSPDEMIISSYMFFSNESILHSIVGKSVGITTDVVTTEPVENKRVPREFPAERPFHLMLGDALGASGGDDRVEIDSSGDAGGGPSPADGPDFTLFVIGLCHFGPPFVC